MAEVKLIAALCPRCGGELRLPNDMRKAHCMYCGAQVIIHRERGGHQVQCKTCGGTGKLELCYSCKGTGSCTWSWSSTAQQWPAGNTVIVANCSNGQCSACGGRGTLFLGMPCSACRGTGKCPECRGSGRCVVCKGFTMLPSSTGTIKCKSCGGDGLVEEFEAEAPELEKCPSCGSPWASGGLFCAKCGHPKICPRCGVPWEPMGAFCTHCGYRKRVSL